MAAKSAAANRAVVWPVLRRCVRAANGCPDPAQRAMLRQAIRLRFDYEKTLTVGSVMARRKIEEAREEAESMEYMLRLKREDDDKRRARAAAGPRATSVGAQGTQDVPVANSATLPAAQAAQVGGKARAGSPSCLVQLQVPPHSSLSLEALVQFLAHFGPLDGCTIERTSGRVAATFAHETGAQACRVGFPSVFGAAENASTS